ncbi:hypothetical protein BE04_18050 [Sorangium cellulosum]|uniref:Uncharacterized protein n=1 Tax=Sorangium cellulosum TaxID=56 RepID=A0A150Q4T7_SORCE|nr:hypothetical protein BE04_18050 [Sorangium cellulosum]
MASECVATMSCVVGESSRKAGTSRRCHWTCRCCSEDGLQQRRLTRAVGPREHDKVERRPLRVAQIEADLVDAAEIADVQPREPQAGRW